MVDYQTGIQQITDGQGLPIAMAGMTIVFCALSMISLFIACLPRLLRAVARVFPEPVAPTPRQRAVKDDSTALIAAAARAYHAARGGG